MEMKYAHLCDYAFIAGGKLSVIGIFNRIWGKEFPLVHAMAYLAFEMELAAPELGTKFNVRIDVRDQDGGKIASIGMEVQSEGSAPPGARPTFRHVMPLQNMKFEKSGQYELAFFINNRYEYSLYLEVAERDEKQAPGGAG